MKKTLIIHIGWHKTATTVIQLYLANCREKLRKYDICYPAIDNQTGYGRIKHSDLLVSVFNELHPRYKRSAIRPFSELFELSVKEINDSKCRWAVLSEEGFSMENPGISKLMGRYKEYFDEIKIVAYVRRQDYFFESFHSQVVKQSVTRDTKNLDAFLSHPGIKKRADYALILDWWAAEFGKENILVAPFERQTVVPDPLTYFFNLAGLPTKIFDEFPLEKIQAHNSPPREVTEFFRYLNMKGVDFHEKALCGYLLKSGATLTDTKYFGRAERERILREYGSSNERVAREYLNRENGVLFEEPVREYLNCPETWTGLTPEDVLDYAMPVIGMMSFEISRLRNENQRISIFKKKISNFLDKIYRRMIKKHGNS
ncbi:MAG: hypothetical protein KJ804_20565 [Proteobacteria bacterium]|nr:hypothetical protein [Pseudomonadota bacterium]MBU1060702.1 hypothetical protein [Pseudomonadota bacterium]